MKNGMNVVFNRWMLIFCLGFYGALLKGAVELKPHPADKKEPSYDWRQDVKLAIKRNDFDGLEKELLKYPREDITVFLRDASAPEMVRFLVKKGADVRKISIKYGSFISYFIKKCSDLSEEKKLSLVKELRILGADPLAGVDGDNQSSAIHCAALNGYSKIITELLRNGVPVDSTAFEGGKTPLHCAWQNEHLEAIKTLVEAGANVWSKDSSGVAPFGYVDSYLDDRSLEHESMVTYMFNLLGEEVFTRRMCDFGPTLFEQACRVKSYCLPLYLERASKEFLCNFKGPFGEGSVLHVIAAMNGRDHPEEVRQSVVIALAKGVGCNVKGKEGNRPLHCAAGTGKNLLGAPDKNVPFVEELLRRCKIVNGGQQ